MTIKITSKRQATFPARVLTALGVKAGDRLELQESAEGFRLLPKKVHLPLLAPLRGKISKSKPLFDLAAFREQAHDRALRD